MNQTILATSLSTQLKNVKQAAKILDAAQSRILVLDGAMGTSIQKYNLSETGLYYFRV